MPSSSSSRQSCNEIIEQTGQARLSARPDQTLTLLVGRPRLPLSEGGVLAQLAEHDLTEGSNSAAVALIVRVAQYHQMPR